VPPPGLHDEFFKGPRWHPSHAFASSPLELRGICATVASFARSLDNDHIRDTARLSQCSQKWREAVAPPGRALLPHPCHVSSLCRINDRLLVTGGADKVVRLWDVMAPRDGKGCYPGWSNSRSSSNSGASGGGGGGASEGGFLGGGGGGGDNENLTMGERAALSTDEGGPLAVARDSSGGLDRGVCLLALPGHSKGVDCVARLSSTEPSDAYP